MSSSSVSSSHSFHSSPSRSVPESSSPLRGARSDSVTVLVPSDPLSSSSAPPASDSAPKRSKARYFLGLFLLLAVIILWVVSGALIQSIFSDDSFNSPFFLTYFSNSLFTVYLFSYAAFAYWHYSLRFHVFRVLSSLRSPGHVKAASGSPKLRAANYSLNNERMALNSEPDSSLSSAAFDSDDSLDPALASSLLDWISRHLASRGQCSLMETMKLSLLFCPLWFPLNYFYNLSLSLTSIASSTIISSTSSLFVLIFSVLFLRQRLLLVNLFGVACTIAGAAIISIRDQADSGESGPERSFRGDILAALGAMFYGIYSVNLQRKIPDESKVSMQLFFGFIGLFNMSILWPGFFILHWSGIELFQLPGGAALGFLILNGLLGTVLSDFLWAQAVLRTSPLIATVGVSLTIPLAMVWDSIAHHHSFGLVYVGGATLVVSGFFAVNWRYSKKFDENSAENAGDEADESVRPRSESGDTDPLSRDSKPRYAANSLDSRMENSESPIFRGMIRSLETRSASDASDSGRSTSIDSVYNGGSGGQTDKQRLHDQNIYSDAEEISAAGTESKEESTKSNSKSKKKRGGKPK